MVFKIDTTGQETVLYTFPNGGGNPRSGAVRDPAGNLYGTAAGFVYKLDTAGKFSVLYRFTGGADGGGADAGVVLDSAGNLYGTTAAGGTAGDGVVYMLDASDRYRETVLYSFTGGADGNQPLSGVVRDAAGNLYGTTFAGGTSGAGGGSGAGVVYKLDTSGQETVLYSFTGGSDGCSPAADVILDSAGTLYGTTNGGGTAVGSAGSGVVFELDTARQETVLHTFTGGADGAYPEAGVIPDHAGSLYGTTYSGGAGGVGSVYKVSAAGQETLLYGFPVTGDGGDPVAGVIRDSAGNLYGTTQEGGAAGWGTVYKLDKTGDETVLYSFTGGADGGDPEAGVIRDSAGNPYGTTLYSDDSMGCGVVYKLDTAGQETVLHTFKGGDDGCVPYAGVTLDSAGNLYGTTQNGGASGWGVVYKVDTSGQETVLYSFTGGPDGGRPYAGVIRDSAGNLYGTAYDGGNASSCTCGVVYKVDTSGHESVLYSFTGEADGGHPYAGLMGDSTGNLYGTTGLGGLSDGYCPDGCGVIYKLDPAGQETVLYSFEGYPGAGGSLSQG